MPAALKIQQHFTLTVNLAQWGGSSLTDTAIEVPTDGAQSGEIPSTYVPGRNTVFLAIALSLAEAKNAEAIYLGINAVDYSGYPDCRPDYLAAYQHLATLSSKAGMEGNAPKLIAPLVLDSKTEIVRRALKLGVPIALTWSCYQGNAEPCGLCDSCRIRDRALIEAGQPDLATAIGRKLYAEENSGFWRMTARSKSSIRPHTLNHLLTQLQQLLRLRWLETSPTKRFLGDGFPLSGQCFACDRQGNSLLSIVRGHDLALQ